jgi:hypothetical protein
LLVLQTIRTVERYVANADLGRHSLKNVLQSPKATPGSPERKTIMLPSCTHTPTKRKANTLSD